MRASGTPATKALFSSPLLSPLPPVENAMIEAYKIGFTIALTNQVSGVLAVISRDLAKSDADAKRLQATLRSAAIGVGYVSTPSRSDARPNASLCSRPGITRGGGWCGWTMGWTRAGVRCPVMGCLSRLDMGYPKSTLQAMIWPRSCGSGLAIGTGRSNSFNPTGRATGPPRHRRCPPVGRTRHPALWELSSACSRRRLTAPPLCQQVHHHCLK